MKNLKDPIRDRTHNLPGCRTVPQPSATFSLATRVFTAIRLQTLITDFLQQMVVQEGF